MCSSLVYDSINNLKTAVLVSLLIILSGDIELNPGPDDTLREYCVSVLHCNMRSIRNQLEYIIGNFCDFDCLCFTETHLDDSVENVNISFTDFSIPFRKDRTNHGGWLTLTTTFYIKEDQISKYFGKKLSGSKLYRLYKRNNSITR